MNKLQIKGFGPLTKISSTYTSTITKIRSLRTNRETSEEDWAKANDLRPWNNLLNHALEACLRPYKDFLSLQTRLGKFGSLNLGGCCMKTSFFLNHHVERHYKYQADSKLV